MSAIILQARVWRRRSRRIRLVGGFPEFGAGRPVAPVTPEGRPPDTTLMSSQAEVHSIEALKDLRVALAFFADDVLGALGGVDMEVRRTVQWLQHDRKAYWQEQIKRRREQVSSARRKSSAASSPRRPITHPPTASRKSCSGGRRPACATPRCGPSSSRNGSPRSSRPYSNTTRAPDGSKTLPRATSPALAVL